MSKSGKIILVVVIILILAWIFYKYYNKRPNKQQLLVLRNFNPEAGLHWMSIYNTIVADSEEENI